MKDKEILEGIKEYFDIYELVGKRTYKKFGESAWQFMDIRTLHCLLIIRKGLNKQIIVNDWKFGGSMEQRGLRTYVQNMIKNMIQKKRLYLSPHIFGKAIDFSVKGMNAQEVRYWILQNSVLFPCKIRLEHRLKGKPITWVHLDTFHKESNPDVYFFDI